MIEDNGPLESYEMIDWSKQPSLFIRKTKLTKHEAHTLNRALAMNQTTLRYVKTEQETTNKGENS